MTKDVKIIVEQHPDGFVAYPVGLRGVIVGEGDARAEAIADVTSAIQFHVETFGITELEMDEPLIGVFRCRHPSRRLMNKFPVDAPIARVFVRSGVPHRQPTWAHF